MFDSRKWQGTLALAALLVGTASGCGASASPDACSGRCGRDVGLADAQHTEAGRADARTDARHADGTTDLVGPPPVPGPLKNGVETLAGWSVAGHKDGLRYNARFANPANVVVGPSGDVYVADYRNNAIRVITTAGVVRTLTPGSTTFKQPFGMVWATNGKFYVQTDYEATGSVQSGALWEVDLVTGKPTLVLDRAGRARGLVALPDGRIALLQYWVHAIELFDPVSRNRTPLAGKAEAPGYVNGKGAIARFNIPYDGVVIAGGDLVITDAGNHRLRRVTLAGQVSDFAGNGAGQSASGSLKTASFNKPQGLAQDSAGTLYVTDVGGHVVRKIAAGQVTTIAGDGIAGVRDHEKPLKARFFGLEGIDVDGSGKTVYVADGDGGESLPFHRVRRIAFP